MNEKCVGCGKFIPYSDMGTDGAADFYFEPDSHFGPERSEWTCKRCVEDEMVVHLSLDKLTRV